MFPCMSRDTTKDELHAFNLPMGPSAGHSASSPEHTRNRMQYRNSQASRRVQW